MLSDDFGPIEGGSDTDCVADAQFRVRRCLALLPLLCELGLRILSEVASKLLG